MPRRPPLMRIKADSFADRPPISFDMLSINIGGQPDLGAIEGAAENGAGHCQSAGLGIVLMI